MPWLRIGDTAATDPRVLAVMEHPDAGPGAVVELFGFVVLCATTAAQHLTDYVITYAAAVQAAGSRENADRLLSLAEWAGYGENRTDPDTGRRQFVIVQDPDLIHMRSAAELTAERQRKLDVSNVTLTVPVRHRDGDSCRYCGLPGSWADRKSARGLTYDHRAELTTGPATPDTLVVACKHCNSARGAIMANTAGHYPAKLAAADAAHPLRPVPHTPYHHPATLAWLAQHAAILTTNGMQLPEPGHAEAPAPDTAPHQGVRPNAAALATPPQAAAPAPDTAPRRQGVRPGAEQRTTRAPRISGNQQIPGIRNPEVPGRVRAGSGSDSGRDGSGPSTSKSRRGQRGGRRKPRQDTQP